jgi:hypothetical protein
MAWSDVTFWRSQSRSGGGLSSGAAKRGMRALIERGHIRARWDRDAWTLRLVEHDGTGAAGSSA